MFQYAAAKGFKKPKEKMLFDLSFFNANNLHTDLFTPRILELSLFNNIKITKTNSFINNVICKSSLFFRFVRKILSKLIVNKTQIENEFCLFKLQKYRINILDGYFQSEKYFNFIRNDLIHDFKFPELDAENELIKEQIIHCKNSVCLHIRRGDYLKPKVLEYMGILPLSYYEKAILILDKRLGNPTYFLFSDDKEYCIQNFSYLKNKFLITANTNENSWKDMALMTNCKHHVIANSSFSWWGAWLSIDDGFKFAPLNWFNPKVANYNIEDFIPSNWELLNND